MIHARVAVEKNIKSAVDNGEQDFHYPVRFSSGFENTDVRKINLLSYLIRSQSIKLKLSQDHGYVITLHFSFAQIPLVQ